MNKKPCEACLSPQVLRYRIKFDEMDGWKLVCPGCQKKLSENNPHYRYGGTWKAKKRR